MASVDQTPVPPSSSKPFFTRTLRALLFASPLVAAGFFLIMVWQRSDTVCDAYPTGIAVRRDYGFLVGAGRLITSSDADRLYTRMNALNSVRWQRTEGYYLPSNSP